MSQLGNQYEQGNNPWESPSIFNNRHCLHERTHAHTNAFTHAYAYVAVCMNNALCYK